MPKTPVSLPRVVSYLLEDGDEIGRLFAARGDLGPKLLHRQDDSIQTCERRHVADRHGVPLVLKTRMSIWITPLQRALNDGN